MSFILSMLSKQRLATVHADLQKVVRRALEVSSVDFRVQEGRRSLDMQRKLVAKGASQTLRSRHLSGHAVDLVAVVDGHIRWDWPLYDKIALAMKAAAAELDVPLEWGGDWRTFKDGPHFQLPWKHYPKGE